MVRSATSRTVVSSARVKMSISWPSPVRGMNFPRRAAGFSGIKLSSTAAERLARRVSRCPLTVRGLSPAPQLSQEARLDPVAGHAGQGEAAEGWEPVLAEDHLIPLGGRRLPLEGHMVLEPVLHEGGDGEGAFTPLVQHDRVAEREFGLNLLG